jgi:predicted DsbA family dithiol-disulfide isomerase
MIRVYFDFLCPYAWRGVELLSDLRVPFEPLHYSLVQGNHAENAGLPRAAPAWRLIEQPLEEGSEFQRGSLMAFLASHAAAKQDKALHLAFILALFRARHRDGKMLNQETILEAAREAELDLAQFESDLGNEAVRRAELARDLTLAGELGVFGTPTVQMEDGRAAYFRFAELPESTSAKLEAWNLFQSVLLNSATIETIKRAKPGSKA